MTATPSPESAEAQDVTQDLFARAYPHRDLTPGSFRFIVALKWISTDS